MSEFAFGWRAMRRVCASMPTFVKRCPSVITKGGPMTTSPRGTTKEQSSIQTFPRRTIRTYFVVLTHQSVTGAVKGCVTMNKLVLENSSYSPARIISLRFQYQLRWWIKIYGHRFLSNVTVQKDARNRLGLPKLFIARPPPLRCFMDFKSSSTWINLNKQIWHKANVMNNIIS
jgi:hypothetical protein